MRVSRCFPKAFLALSSVVTTIGFAAEPRMSTVALANSRGWTPDVLAASLLDGDSAITLVANTGTFAIKNQLRPDATTDLRAIGIFEDGNAPAGTSFNDPVDPNAVLAGGLELIRVFAFPRVFSAMGNQLGPQDSRPSSACQVLMMVCQLT
jgi:hypothetical protein